MKPTFENSEEWERANLLMQPAFIRVLDNIRKLMEEHPTWKSSYPESLIWDPSVSEEERGRIGLLQQELKTTTSNDRAIEIEQVLETLPKPYLVYEWRLERDIQIVAIDLWELCYQVCFTDDYHSSSNQPAQVDRRLLDDWNEVDWRVLDDKAKQLVLDILSQLPMLSP